MYIGKALGKRPTSPFFIGMVEGPHVNRPLQLTKASFVQGGNFKINK